MHPNYILETERCRLRQMEESDADFLVALNQHPDIYKFTWDPPFATTSEAQQFILSYSAYRDFGMGRWIVELKSDHTAIGWCGLKFHPDNSEIDLGYRFLPEYWGSGFAPECGAACLDWAKNNEITEVISCVHKDNRRSVRVSEKLGFEYAFDRDYNGVAWMIFRKQLQ